VNNLPHLVATEPLKGTTFIWYASTPVTIHGFEVFDGNNTLLFQQWGTSYHLQSGDYIQLVFAFT
jgi:hypothetical protein